MRSTTAGWEIQRSAATRSDETLVEAARHGRTSSPGPRPRRRTDRWIAVWGRVTPRPAAGQQSQQLVLIGWLGPAANPLAADNYGPEMHAGTDAAARADAYGRRITAD